MGYVFSAYLDREGEPAFNPEVFEKLEDTSRPVRSKLSFLLRITEQLLL